MADSRNQPLDATLHPKFRVERFAMTLNGWKEISQYMGRGVRTVQRWERLLGLPVHRPTGAPRSAVLAISTEIDDWLRSSPVHQENIEDLELLAVRLKLLERECERIRVVLNQGSSGMAA
jgi:hypothetical protein